MFIRLTLSSLPRALWPAPRPSLVAVEGNCCAQGGGALLHALVCCSELTSDRSLLTPSADPTAGPALCRARGLGASAFCLKPCSPVLQLPGHPQCLGHPPPFPHPVWVRLFLLCTSAGLRAPCPFLLDANVCRALDRCLPGPLALLSRRERGAGLLLPHLAQYLGHRAQHRVGDKHIFVEQKIKQTNSSIFSSDYEQRNP